MSSSSRVKSQIWLHFSTADAEKKVKCLYCSQKLSIANKSTCSLIRHMNKKHPTQQIIRQAVPEFNENIQTQEQPLNQKPLNVAGSVIPRLNKIVQESQKIDGFLFKKSININKQREIDKQLVRMIAKEYHPFSLVEDQEFVKFIHLLNPAYKIPTRKTVSHSLIPAIYNETLEKVKSRINRAYAVCLTADGWTSRTQESYYAITAHYVVENNEGIALDSDLLGCVQFTERHTGENICKKMKDIMTEWHIENKVIVIVTDNAANMKAAVRSGEWRHWACFAHSLNLISQAGMKEIQSVIDKIKVIVSFFKKSSYATAQLSATQQNMNIPFLKLKNDVPTRWNSTYDMLRRILTIKNAVVSTLAILKSSLIVRNEDLEAVDILTHDEWLIVEQVVQIFEIFDALTTVISTENKVTISSIIIYLKQIKSHLNTYETNSRNFMPEINNVISRLLTEVNTRFFSDKDHIEDNELIGFSTILDPRFKKFGFIEESKYRKMLDKLYNKVARLKHTENTSKSCTTEILTQITETCTNMDNKLDNLIFKDFDNVVQKYLRPVNTRASAVVEVDKYLEEPILQRKDANGVNTDPLLWWYQRKHIYPRLFQIAKTRLCIMATSVPCERIFSRAGQIVNEKRGNLKASKISQIVFLNYNLKDAS